jgi:hypothetical protein
MGKEADDGGIAAKVPLPAQAFSGSARELAWSSIEGEQFWDGEFVRFFILTFRVVGMLWVRLRVK